MTMTNDNTPPDPLPATLPPGMKFHGATIMTKATLRSPHTYRFGRWRTESGIEYESGAVNPHAIDWNHWRSLTQDRPIDSQEKTETVAHRICSTCPAPATHGEHCVYCAHRKAPGMNDDIIWESMRCKDAEGADDGADATARLLASLASEKPRVVSATSRQLQLGPPSTWPSLEG